MSRILVIEEDRSLLACLTDHLGAAGHIVHKAEGGKAGLEDVLVTHPDLIILSLLIPFPDGFEVLAVLKERRTRVKIIALCEDKKSLPAGLLLKMALKLGADQVLAKPFSLSELDMAMDLLIDRKIMPAEFLVLDDDADARFIRTQALKKAFPRSTVVQCDSPAAALEASATKRFDAIITDHHLGLEDGAKFVENLRTRGGDCPVIMDTGSSDPAVHQRAYKAGAERVFFGGNRDFTTYLKQKLSRLG